MIQTVRVQWFKQLGSSFSESVTDMTVTPSGHCLLTGAFSDSLAVDTMVLTNAENYGLYVLHYDPNGTALWATGIEVPNGNAITTAITDFYELQIIVGGNFYDTLTVAGQSIATQAASNGFLLTYDFLSHNVWQAYALPADSAATVEITDVAGAEGTNNVLVSGSFTDTFNIFSQSVTAVGTDGFVVAYNPFFPSFAWLRVMSGTGYDRATCVAADGLGNGFAAGIFSDILFNFLVARATLMLG